ncbi:MAG: alpha/beta hydrolase [Acidimicrobiales bacterium]
MEQQSFEVAGVRLEALVAGAGGAPLLLVHGFTGCKEDFADELDPLADLGYHVVAPDLRGHGDSDFPLDESEYSLEHFADDMFGLADALGWSRFDLLGHSMGGMIAQRMVLDRPERIGRLVLMDTHHGVLGDLDHDLIAIGVELARTQGLKVIQEILQMGADPLANPAYERICAERPGYREFAENKMLRASPVMYAAMLQVIADTPDRLDELASVSSPTLVQVGELDAAFVDASHRMAAVIEGASIVVHPDAGHCPQFENTESWRTSLHDFLGPAAASAVA